MTAPATVDVQERTSGAYEATLLDEDDAAIAAASIDSITLTLIETRSGDVVNSRSAQSVLNANGGTMHATSGLFRWEWEPEDTAILGSTPNSDIERHLATITVTWDSGTKQQHREVLLRIKNLRSVPQA